MVELLIDRVMVTDGDVEIHDVIPTTSASEHIRFSHLRTNYLGVFSLLAPQRDLGADPYHIARAGAAAEWAPTTSTTILGSQSVKASEQGSPHGYDGVKKLSGRKRHLLVDTLGLVLGVMVHSADIQDRASAPRLLRLLHTALPRLELIWADNAYLGPLQTWVWETFGWRLTIVERPGGRGQWLRADQEPPVRMPGFQLMPRCWVVERALAWIGRNRRMSKDYEFLPTIRETWVSLSMVCLMLKRLVHEHMQPAFHYRRSV